MFRISSLFFVVVAVVAGTLLFQTSQSVQRLEGDLHEVTQDVGHEKESLRILGAEWDYLNRPERLEKLTLENLDMDAVHAEKTDFISNGAAVPEPEIPVLPPVKPKNLLIPVAMQTQSKVTQSKVKESEAVKPDLKDKSFESLVEPDTRVEVGAHQ